MHNIELGKGEFVLEEEENVYSALPWPISILHAEQNGTSEAHELQREHLDNQPGSL